jgi:hypothetical protein
MSRRACTQLQNLLLETQNAWKGDIDGKASVHHPRISPLMGQANCQCVKTRPQPWACKLHGGRAVKTIKHGRKGNGAGSNPWTRVCRSVFWFSNTQRFKLHSDVIHGFFLVPIPRLVCWVAFISAVPEQHLDNICTSTTLPIRHGHP